MLLLQCDASQCESEDKFDTGCYVCVDPNMECKPSNEAAVCGYHGTCSAGKCNCDDSSCCEPECQQCRDPYKKECDPKGSYPTQLGDKDGYNGIAADDQTCGPSGRCIAVRRKPGDWSCSV